MNGSLSPGDPEDVCESGVRQPGQRVVVAQIYGSTISRPDHICYWSGRNLSDDWLISISIGGEKLCGLHMLIVPSGLTTMAV